MRTSCWLSEFWVNLRRVGRRCLWRWRLSAIATGQTCRYRVTGMATAEFGVIDRFQCVCRIERGNTMASKCPHRLTSVLAWLVTALLLGGCAGHANPGGESAASRAAGPDATSAWTLVKVLTAAGLAVPNPRDVTAQRCADIHCAGAVAAARTPLRVIPVARMRPVPAPS